MSVVRRHQPSTMYSSSTGAFRTALDRWRLRMLETKNRAEQRKLNLLIETIAGRWLNNESHDELALEINNALGPDPRTN